MLSIVPKGAKLEAQLFGPSSAIGFIRAGQRVMLRYQAYPYQKFGQYEGTVASVSRSAISPSELSQQLAGLTSLYGANVPVYRITVTLASQTVRAYGEPVPLQPGMQLEADIMMVRRRFSVSLKGATLKDLIGIADQLGLASRPLRLELDELHMLKLPCILHWDLSHFVVLKSTHRGGVTIHDPGFGVRRLSLAQISHHFTGIALELTPTSRFQPAAAPPRIRIRALLGDLVGLRRSLGQLLALALANEVFAMVSPLFLVWVVDQALVTA